MITDRRLMTEICLVLDGKRILMTWEPRLLAEFDAWRADRHCFNRSDAIRKMIRWAAQHAAGARQRPVQPDEPVLALLDAFMAGHVIIARSEGIKLCILSVLRQPWPVGNARPEKKKLRTGVPELRQAPRLVVDNDVAT